jgi:hypothetical protein
MHWVYQNVNEPSEKEDLINKSLKETPTNISDCSGSENQCL